MGSIGCSAFFQSALCQSWPSSIYYSPPSVPSHKKSARKRRVSAIVSSGRAADECFPFHRRTVLFVGVSVLPFLQPIDASADEQEEAIYAVSYVGGFANIFLYQRNRRKDAKARSTKVLDDLAFEEKEALDIMGSRETQSKKFDIDALDRVLGEEVRVQEGRESELEIESQGPGAAEHDFEAQPPKINEPEIPFPQSKQSHVEVIENTSGNVFVSLLSGIGIIGSGVLGALYAASQGEKKALELTVDSMKTQVKNQEMAATSLKDSFKARLLSEHEEHQRQLGRLKNEEASLSSQLNSAKDAVVASGRELQTEKRLVEELIAQKRQLERSFAQSMEDKKSLEAALHEKADKVTNLEDKLSLLSLELKEKEKTAQNLGSLLSESESECKNLSSTIEQAREDLAAANSSIEQLKEDNFKARDESSSKGSIIDDLHAKIKSFSEEKDDSTRKFYDLMKDYDELISYSESTAILNSELQAKKDEQLRQLEESFKLASSEISCNQTTIFELTRERDNLNDFLEKEKDDIYRLTNELQSARELLSSSRVEFSHISKELVETKTGYEEAMSKILKMQKYYDQERQSLNTNLEEAKANTKIISDELESANAVCRRTEDALVSASIELKAVIEERESLKKELVDTYKRLETTTNQLKEEMKIVSDLNKELDDLHKQILKDSQSRKSLEADLEEATRSLDEMNRSALLLSRELENTNSRSSSLEVETEILYKSLSEQKTLTKEAHENIDDAKNFITKLGSERERLEKRSKRFEEELAAAKGEILRLRRNISSDQEFMTKIHSESIEVPAGTPFSVKKNPARRKKRSSGTDNS